MSNKAIRVLGTAAVILLASFLLGGSCTKTREEACVGDFNLSVGAPNSLEGTVGQLVEIEYSFSFTGRDEDGDYCFSADFASSSTSVLDEPDTSAMLSVSCVDENGNALSMTGENVSDDTWGPTARVWWCLSPSEIEIDMKCTAFYECLEAETATAYAQIEGSDPCGKSADVPLIVTEVTCAAGGESCDDDFDEETKAALEAAMKLGMTKAEFCNLLHRVTIEEILHSAESIGAKATADDHTETQAFVVDKVNLSSAKAASLFSGEMAAKDMTDFPCGEGTYGYTVCPSGAGDFPEGETILLFNIVVGDVPLADGTNLYQYGFVFDQDGDTGNNYTASTAYPNDFFDATDRWYVANYSPSGGWSLTATDALKRRHHHRHRRAHRHQR